MKKNLEILKCEHKITDAGLPYMRFQTSEGWMSCFNSKANEELKKQVNHLVCVNVVESPSKDGSRVFMNITEFHGPPEQGVSTTVINQGAPKEEFPVVKPGMPVKEPKNHATMYVSYAKDVFCRLSDIDNKDGNPRSPVDDVIKQSIEVVKSFKTAFE